MDTLAYFSEARKSFHAALLGSVLQVDHRGIPSNADGSNQNSIRIALGILTQIGEAAKGARLAGQMSGNKFEEICKEFLVSTFLKLGHLRPGKWDIKRITSRNRLEIAKYEQYAHLIELYRATKGNIQLAAALGSDYTITPDVIIIRYTEDDPTINISDRLVDEQSVRLADLREMNGGRPLLHASISCKWTIRSDRSQNARSEAYNLVRNRKGHLPHVVVVTGEPLPSRLASIALGTGDIDYVYHFALPELTKTVKTLGLSDAEEMLEILVKGKRLKDISDLPLDLAV
ncbi:MAG TPA: NgoMIV family type II restriction endonuclease [Alphaproteobacteria bacterium]|nr:NgoMIV family type II restriction endonuclease [Alphaproteobacteria bacterium]